MLDWQGELLRGKRCLSRHQPGTALRFFERAMVVCPVDRSKELAQILFYIGITLKKLGLSNCALKSWGAAQRLHKHRFAAKLLRRFANSYGMARQSSVLLDDWKAFYSIHLLRYLNTKNSGRIGADAERDMVTDLIFEAWQELNEGYNVAQLTTAEKLALFRSTRIIYPAFSVDRFQRVCEEPISVDFSRKKKVFLEDQCFCGSGLPYHLCCGRTPGEDELVNGVI